MVSKFGPPSVCSLPRWLVTLVGLYTRQVKLAVLGGRDEVCWWFCGGYVVLPSNKLHWKSISHCVSCSCVINAEWWPSPPRRSSHVTENNMNVDGTDGVGSRGVKVTKVSSLAQRQVRRAPRVGRWVGPLCMLHISFVNHAFRLLPVASACSSVSCSREVVSLSRVLAELDNRCFFLRAGDLIVSRTNARGGEKFAGLAVRKSF